jgi:hypothetical protein
MRGRALDFADRTAVNGSLASPGAPFGQLLGAAFDEAMTPNEWRRSLGRRLKRHYGTLVWTSGVCTTCLGFAARYGVVVRRLP